jgi:hypothetical protein
MDHRQVDGSMTAPTISRAEFEELGRLNADSPILATIRRMADALRTIETLAGGPDFSPLDREAIRTEARDALPSDWEK